MRFQDLVSPTTPEKVFRLVRNSYTNTLTASVFKRGQGCILQSASASCNGYDIAVPSASSTTAAVPENNLYAGVIADYPDTSVAQTGDFQPEAYGYAQCYGFHSAVVFSRVGAGATATQAGGQVLQPHVSGHVTVAPVVLPSGTNTSDTGVFANGVIGLIVLMQSLATDATTNTTAVKAFIRAM